MAILICSFLIFAALPAQAVKILTPGTPLTTVDKTVEAVCIGIKWFLLAAIFGSVFFGIQAGWTYIFSEGKEQETTRARKMLTYALIGVALAMAALGAPQVMANFLEVGDVKACSFQQ